MLPVYDKDRKGRDPIPKVEARDWEYSERVIDGKARDWE
jgi:hypothetical protein